MHVKNGTKEHCIILSVHLNRLSNLKGNKVGDKEVARTKACCQRKICLPPTMPYVTFSTLSEEEMALPSFPSHRLLYGTGFGVLILA